MARAGGASAPHLQSNAKNAPPIFSAGARASSPSFDNQLRCTAAQLHWSLAGAPTALSRTRLARRTHPSTHRTAPHPFGVPARKLGFAGDPAPAPDPNTLPPAILPPPTATSRVAFCVSFCRRHWVAALTQLLSPALVLARMPSSMGALSPVRSNHGRIPPSSSTTSLVVVPCAARCPGPVS